ncbi:bactoprenol glucosyl transferase [Parvularcula lutaonensis]|nr:bactoprenol glucosyl transferase [Parvularcula lutaonensis]
MLREEPVLSLIVPMLNEEEMVPVFHERLSDVLEGIGETYEVICIDDGSSDGTFEALAAIHARDRRWKTIRFSRNFGKEIALSAGIKHARGAAVIPIDADLQDPPELIAEMLEKWREGYDVVCAVRRRRDEDTWLKKTSASLFYRIMGRVTNIHMTPNAGDFRLMDRRVVAAINRLPERNRFMKGLFAWVGFEQAIIEYARPQRAAGKSKFNFWRLWNFSLDGITSFTTLPLRISGYLGGVIATLAMVYGVILIARHAIFGADVPGYTSIMVAVLALGGLQLVILGVIGEYLGRLYTETKRRPLYVIDAALGFDEPTVPPVSGS